ncbi:MAG TPA: TniB family NTP-binding protein [Rhodanobacter sp.]|nr:TniB family NTP-binding protein [Rhodanobacter sp.]
MSELIHPTSPERFGASSSVILPARTEENVPTEKDNYSHLAATVHAQAALGKQERIAIIRGDLVVRYPAVAHMLSYTRWLLDGPSQTRTTGMLVTGPVGAGKTTFARLVQRTYARKSGADAVPIISISLTGARHTRTVYGRILEALNGPVKNSHRTSDREATVVRLLKTVRCRALIVDEVQDVLAGSVQEQRRALDAIKFLMNELQLPILALGVTAAAEAFRSDMHLDARFKRFELATWDVGEPFANFLRSVMRLLPLREPSRLDTEAAMKFMVKHSGGSLDGIMTLIRQAAVHAVVSGEERIESTTLQKALTIPDMEDIDRAAA